MLWIKRNRCFGSTMKSSLIQNSIKHVKKYGWSDKAIICACQQLNLSPSSHRLIKPYNIISYLMKSWNKKSIQTIQDTSFGENKKITDKINFSIKTRLLHQVQYIDVWQEAMAIGAHPSNIAETKNILWEYSDSIWYLCGDKSTDYNYYTKRILFNAAYASTQLHLLTDQTESKQATWKFLQRRLSDINNMGASARDAKIVLSSLSTGLLSVFGMFNKIPEEVENPIQKQKEEQIKSPISNTQDQSIPK